MIMIMRMTAPSLSVSTTTTTCVDYYTDTVDVSNVNGSSQKILTVEDIIIKQVGSGGSRWGR